jgi:UDP-N-acetylglucosamine--dolichyl-phosphate N-acetylglucosaminephosphotransferase
MGGLAIILGFYVGVIILVVTSTEGTSRTYYYAALSASLGAGAVGILDDAFNIRKRTKAIAPFFLALPLGAAAVASGNTILLGLNIGYLMVLVVAAGVTSAANAANMLEGFNGLGAGLMICICVTLIILSMMVGSKEGLFLLFPLLGALVAFLWFNRYPARVFPGDSMTLFSGATIASAAIVSSPSLKTVGALLFLPMIAEFILKARARFDAENYGQIDADGYLRHDGPIRSLAHVVMRYRRLREYQVVALLWAMEAVICAAVIAGVAVGL